ncbi:hypothetical protein Goshw_008802, partial [Gossypium schwendimanii]|nr:hypothetical protein [Gossypium schwendimanii]
MSLNPIEAELGEGLPSNVIDDNELNIINIHPSDAWIVMSGFSQSSVFSQNSLGTKRKWVLEEDVVLVTCMVDLHNVGTFNTKPNLESRIGTMKMDWSIVYDMFSGKNNSSFGWDEHRQLIVVEDAVWDSYKN